jgi:hypothetical protein
MARRQDERTSQLRHASSVFAAAGATTAPEARLWDERWTNVMRGRSAMFAQAGRPRKLTGNFLVAFIPRRR